MKKIVSAFLCTTMVASILAGCTGRAQQPTDTADATQQAAQETETAPQTAQAGDESQPADTQEQAANAAPQAAEPASEALDISTDTGKVLNIYCWNETFKSLLGDHYPGYEEVDVTHGKIGDIEVVWNIIPTDENEYQDSLDERLLAQIDTPDDEKVDLFLVDADCAFKYVDTDYTLPVSELGISEADIADQYQFTKDVATDTNGVLKGVSWQCCPLVMFYNRDIAAEVLGSEEPEAVQEYVKDWSTFNETAAKLKEKDYYALSSVDDSYRVYSSNISSKWVDGIMVHVDDNIKKWVDDSKALVDAGETNTYDFWSEDWKKGFKGGVFAYFGPAWFMNFMGDGEEGTVAANGRWGAVKGPQSCFWDGTWICAAQGTDNPALVGDIMRKLTCDPDIMRDIFVKDDDFANNKSVMAQMVQSDYTSSILGGQNPIPVYMEAAEQITVAPRCEYDLGCSEEFQKAMKSYFDGKVDTYEEAMDIFKDALSERYFELTVM